MANLLIERLILCDLAGIALLILLSAHLDFLVDRCLLLEEVVLSPHLNLLELSIVPLGIDLVGLSLHLNHLEYGIVLLKRHLIVLVTKDYLLKHAVLLELGLL